MSLLRFSYQGSLKRVEILLRDFPNVNINATTTEKRTPLMTAVVYSHPKIVNALFTNQHDIELDPDLQDNDGNTALMLSCQYESKLNFLPKNCLNYQLEFFRKQNARKILHILVSRGADYTIKNKKGEYFMKLLKEYPLLKEEKEEIENKLKSTAQNRWDIIASMLDQNGFSDDLITFFFPFHTDEKNDDFSIDKEGYRLTDWADYACIVQ